MNEEVEYEFESENEPDVLSETEAQIEPERKKYASTKGDADKRRTQCLENLKKAREAKKAKASAKKVADSKVHRYSIQNSESDESEDEIEPPSKKSRSKSQKGGSISSISSSRLDRIEAFMEQIAQAKAKPKARIVKNTIVQVPAYPQQTHDPRITQLTRKLFHDL